MTDKELIQTLRDEDITDVRDMMDCMEAAVDRLEFLLRECAELKLQIQKEICKRVDVEAENEHLREVAKKIPRWISVDERLPEPNKDVLVIAHGWKGKVLYIGQLRPITSEKSWLTGIENKASEWTIWGFSYLREPKVTHWMPLPEPPSTEGVE